VARPDQAGAGRSPMSRRSADQVRPHVAAQHRPAAARTERAAGIRSVVSSPTTSMRERVRYAESEHDHAAFRCMGLGGRRAEPVGGTLGPDGRSSTVMPARSPLPARLVTSAPCGESHSGRSPGRREPRLRPWENRLCLSDTYPICTDEYLHWGPIHAGSNELAWRSHERARRRHPVLGRASGRSVAPARGRRAPHDLFKTAR